MRDPWDLVDGASGHDVAAQEQPDGVFSVRLLLCAFRLTRSQASVVKPTVSLPRATRK